MHLVVIESKIQDGKAVKTALLQDSEKKGDKVKNRTLAKLMDCTDEEINAVQLAFLHKDKLSALDFKTLKPLGKQKALKGMIKPENLSQGVPIGSIWLLLEATIQLGIVEALGDGPLAQVALAQVIATVLHPHLPLFSPLASSTLEGFKLLNLPADNSDNDYRNSLLWLAQNQEEIEEKLYKQRGKKKNHSPLFYFDITKAYFTQNSNPLEIFYEAQEQQPIMALITDETGIPLSILILEESTPHNLCMKLKSLAMRFHAKSITLVGESEIPGRPKGAKPPLYTLGQVSSEKAKDFVKTKIVSEEISDIDVIDGEKNKRYLISRDMKRFRVLTIQRLEQQKHLEFLVEKQNNILDLGSKEKPKKIASRIHKVLEIIDATSWMKVNVTDKKLCLKINKKALKELLYLNGCNVIETTIPKNDIAPKKLMDLFKQRETINAAFCKKSFSIPNEAIITEQASQVVQGHSIVLTLAHILHQHLKKAWAPLNITTEDALHQLSTVCALKSGKQHFIPSLNSSTQKLFEALEISPPKKLS